MPLPPAKRRVLRSSKKVTLTNKAVEYIKAAKAAQAQEKEAMERKKKRGNPNPEDLLFDYFDNSQKVIAEKRDVKLYSVRKAREEIQRRNPSLIRKKPR